jgi:hypothetical protein
LSFEHIFNTFSLCWVWQTEVIPLGDILDSQNSSQCTSHEAQPRCSLVVGNAGKQLAWYCLVYGGRIIWFTRAVWCALEVSRHSFEEYWGLWLHSPYYCSYKMNLRAVSPCPMIYFREYFVAVLDDLLSLRRGDWDKFHKSQQDTFLYLAGGCFHCTLLSQILFQTWMTTPEFQAVSFCLRICIFDILSFPWLYSDSQSPNIITTLLSLILMNCRYCG